MLFIKSLLERNFNMRVLTALVLVFAFNNQNLQAMSPISAPMRPDVNKGVSIDNIERLSDLLGEQDDTTSEADREFTHYIIISHPSSYSKAKRLIDLFFGSIGAVATVALTIPIGIAIKLNEGWDAEVFYSQTRIGFLGKPFKIWKFRSMVKDADKLQEKLAKDNETNGFTFKMKDDPRVTPIGRFIRKTSLDEFPQFFNVLRGEMSMVGTRPPTPNEVKKYRFQDFPRLNVRPGLTGEWQVFGRNDVTNFDDIVEMDMNYQKKWNPWYDIKLILMTFKVLKGSDNAY